MELSRNITIANRHGLAHWRTDEGTWFVTFRLYDSLPRDVPIRRQKIIEESLDRGHGSAFLLDPKVAKVVFEALKFFQGARYMLHSICVMPNHVHAVLRTAPDIRLGDVMRSWKSFTARRANQILSRTGPFWEREWFEWLLHDANELARANAYVMNNPVKAGLVNWPWVERFETEFYAKYREEGPAEGRRCTTDQTAFPRTTPA